MSVTILYQAYPPHPSAAVAEGEDLWVPTSELPVASGWELRPEGACRGEAPEGARAEERGQRRARALELADFLLDARDDPALAEEDGARVGEARDEDLVAGLGASALIWARSRPSSAPASRISTPGPMTSAISGTTSTRGDCPMVTRPTIGRVVLTGRGAGDAP